MPAWVTNTDACPSTALRHPLVQLHVGRHRADRRPVDVAADRHRHLPVEAVERGGAVPVELRRVGVGRAERDEQQRTVGLRPGILGPVTLVRPGVQRGPAEGVDPLVDLLGMRLQHPRDEHDAPRRPPAELVDRQRDLLLVEPGRESGLVGLTGGVVQYRGVLLGHVALVSWQLTGDTPAKHRLTFDLDEAARTDLEKQILGKHVLMTDCATPLGTPHLGHGLRQHQQTL